mmetsp:Transcript_46811/g.133059  ORF Transcript_46811/g.133059 Transcript_46811/m.133059 type:complete len:88 (+) Transcript_46811:86-349(+)
MRCATTICGMLCRACKNLDRRFWCSVHANNSNTGLQNAKAVRENKHNLHLVSQNQQLVTAVQPKVNNVPIGHRNLNVTLSASWSLPC